MFKSVRKSLNEKFNPFSFNDGFDRQLSPG